MNFNLSNIPETLLLPLYGRAIRAQAENSFLKDRFAESVISCIEYDFTLLKNTLKPFHALMWEARAWQIDRVIREFLKVHSCATVVNLGAGLDTTFQRVDNGTMRWIDVDLPEVISIRKHLLPETERSRCFAGSLFEEEWIENIGKYDEILIVSAGCLYYFSEANVKSFFGMLQQFLPGSVVAFDIMTPKAAQKANRMVSDVDMHGKIQWAMKNSRIMESWGTGIRIQKEFGYFSGISRKEFSLGERLIMNLNDWLGWLRIVLCKVDI